MGLLLASCGDQDVPTEGNADVTVVADVPAEDLGDQPDLGTLPEDAGETPVDSGALDATDPADVPADAGPGDPDVQSTECPGGAGCTCDANDDCDIGLCIAGAANKFCAKTCVDSCPDGFKCVPVSAAGGDTINVCAPQYEWLCDPCTQSVSCKGVGLDDAVCINYGAKGSFCGIPCKDDAGCPKDYYCDSVSSVEGSGSKQCVRKTADGASAAGLCSCTDAAIQKKLSTPCTIEHKNDKGEVVGKCPGKRSCGASGLSTCIGPPPDTEICDGADNDCDGKTDEGTCDDSNPCTADACDPSKATPDKDGCVHSKLDTPCDADGNNCTEGDKCNDGICVPGKSKDCDDSNTCTIDACDPAAGCTKTNDDDKSCDADGDACTVGDICKAGACLQGKKTTCDDANPCTKDACDTKSGKCQYKNLPDGASCDDGSACTQADQCLLGGCEGKALICDDKNPCTVNTCDAKAGCQATKSDGAGCDDDNPCTVGDACKDGKCGEGAPKVCKTSDPCLTAKCDQTSGKCKYKGKPKGAPCDDGSKCTKSDGCDDGDCLGKVINCDDGNPCTDDACKQAEGCTYSDTKGPCSDGTACTIGDICAAGQCKAGKKKNCNDDNVCTADTCDDNTGKCKFKQLSSACDDGNACTTKDVCSDGFCAGGAVDCDDSNPCTDDGCDKNSGCTHKANNAPCNDGNACTDNDACAGGNCAGKAKDAKACDDGNPCTTDSCDKKLGCLQVANTASCDDGNKCTVGDTCKSSKCVAGTNTCQCNNDGDCAAKDDGNLCNGTLFCDKSKSPYGCKVNPATVVKCSSGGDSACLNNVCIAKTGKCEVQGIAEGKACDADGTVCTQGDICKAGKCVAGAKVKCDDSNPCTNDSCDAKTGCVHAANTGACNADDNACTTGDACKNKLCIAGPKKKCDDGKVCTADSCDVQAGKCLYNAKLKDGAPCDADNSVCTPKDACGGGTCVPDKQQTCDDKNPCTNDACNAKTGCVFSANTKACNADDNACTVGDVCKDKVCLKGKLKGCDDANPCTADSCDAKSGKCIQDGGLKDGSSCDADGSLCSNKDACKSGKCAPGKLLNCDDGNPCTDDKCDAKKGCVHTANTKACNADNSVCTVSDVCKATVCTKGAKKNCDDGSVCTSDNCDDTKGCIYVANSNQCDADSSVCTVGDFCKDKVCTPGKKKSCDDSNPCTNDVCHPTKGCVHGPNNIPCDDGNPCSSGDYCLNTKCQSGKNVCDCQTNKDCAAKEDGNLCNGTLFCDKAKAPYQCKVDQKTVIQCSTNNDTTCNKNICDGKIGKCAMTPVAAGKSCSDGNACTAGDVCGKDGGGKHTCLAGSAVKCDDNNVCTKDSCDKAKGCVHIVDQVTKYDCYSGKAGTKGVGECVGGKRTCQANGSFDACKGEVVPNAKELCDGKDDDCDSKTDEGCTPVAFDASYGNALLDGKSGKYIVRATAGGGGVAGPNGSKGKYAMHFGFTAWLRAVFGK